MANSIIRFLFACFVFILIVDPGDLIFHLKIPLFALIFVLWLLMKPGEPITLNKETVFIISLFILIPLFGLAISIIQGNLIDPDLGVQFLKSFCTTILIIPLIDKRIPIDRYLIKLGIAIPLIIIPVYFLLSSRPELFGLAYNYLNLEKKVALFSNRNFFGFQMVMLYYRTSPLLVFPLSYYCYQFVKGHKRTASFILAGIFMTTLFLSGTRANILSAILIPLYFLSQRLRQKSKGLSNLAVGTAVILIAAFFFSLSMKEEDVKMDESAEVKAGHFTSYIQHFEQNPQHLIWGQGLGSKFYSTGSGALISQSELTYLELIRWFGLPLTIILLILIVYPVIHLYVNKKINDQNRYIVVAFFLYMFIAGTNPLLVSSTGILVIMMMYGLMYKPVYKPSPDLQNI